MKIETLKKHEKLVWYDEPSKDWDLWCMVFGVVYMWKLTITRMVYIKKVPKDTTETFNFEKIK